MIGSTNVVSIGGGWGRLFPLFVIVPPSRPTESNYDAHLFKLHAEATRMYDPLSSMKETNELLTILNHLLYHHIIIFIIILWDEILTKLFNMFLFIYSFSKNIF